MELQTIFGSRIAHSKLMHMFSLHNGHRRADEVETIEHRAGLATGLAPGCAT